MFTHTSMTAVRGMPICTSTALHFRGIPELSADVIIQHGPDAVSLPPLHGGAQLMCMEMTLSASQLVPCGSP